MIFSPSFTIWNRWYLCAKALPDPEVYTMLMPRSLKSISRSPWCSKYDPKELNLIVLDRSLIPQLLKIHSLTLPWEVIATLCPCQMASGPLVDTWLLTKLLRPRNETSAWIDLNLLADTQSLKRTYHLGRTDLRIYLERKICLINDFRLSASPWSRVQGCRLGFEIWTKVWFSCSGDSCHD